MPDKHALDIFADSKAVGTYLADIALAAGMEARIAATKPAGQHPALISGPHETSLVQGESVRVFKHPVRAGAVIDALHKLLSGGNALPPRLEIAGHFVDTRENLWLRSGETALRLTEKEVAILCLLKESAPSAVSRQVLLDKVWAYAEGVETHTLETHIYRLRQKIETDPSRPEILLTEETGYRING